jgi:hypothetical protein
LQAILLATILTFLLQQREREAKQRQEEERVEKDSTGGAGEERPHSSRRGFPFLFLPLL